MADKRKRVEVIIEGDLEEIVEDKKPSQSSDGDMILGCGLIIAIIVAIGVVINGLFPDLGHTVSGILATQPPHFWIAAGFLTLVVLLFAIGKS